MTSGTVSLTQWKNKVVFLIGGGPSLKRFDFNRLLGKGIVVAINDAFLRIPWADALYSEDKVWFSTRSESIRGFLGKKFFAIQPQLFKDPFPCTLLERSRNIRLSDDPGKINIGGNSGYGALNLAYLSGCREIVLLGYDLKPTNGSGTHWHEGYSWFNKRNEVSYYARWAKQFEDTLPQLEKKGVKVFNTNYDSAVTAFPFAPIKRWL